MSASRFRIGGTGLLLTSLAALAASLLLLQPESAPWPAVSRHGIGQAALLLAAYLLCCALLLRSRRRPTSAAQAHSTRSVLLLWSSQTGTAESLARQSAAWLQHSGRSVDLQPLGGSNPAEWVDCSEVLLVVSSTGEGDAPDDAAAFERRWTRAPQTLTGVRFGLLSLGDRRYSDYCGFGRRLQAWLIASGATQMFDCVEVDAGDPRALEIWRTQVGAAETATTAADEAGSWSLCERTAWNPVGPAPPCFRVVLRPPPGTAADWQAGDVVEIVPRNAAARIEALLAANALNGDLRLPHSTGGRSLHEHLARCRLPIANTPLDLATIANLPPLQRREYSIASLPDEGQVELLVRLQNDADGSVGVGSGWLCLHAPIGTEIELRPRSVPALHPGDPTRPLILIGNGSGMAGLRAQWRARIGQEHGGCWLLFGERRPQDLYYRDEIEQMRRTGVIERVDFAWSRIGNGSAHVQQRLSESADELRRWIDAGAVIHVCGSRAGMSEAVEAILVDALGAGLVSSLRNSGRYRREVY